MAVFLHEQVLNSSGDAIKYSELSDAFRYLRLFLKHKNVYPYTKYMVAKKGKKNTPPFPPQKKIVHWIPSTFEKKS